MTDLIPASRAVPRPRRLRDCVLRVVAVCLLLFALCRQVYASIYFFFGMANDQSGYAPPLSEYSGAVDDSPSDEALFTISPPLAMISYASLQRVHRRLDWGAS